MCSKMFILISFLLFNICHVSIQLNTNDTTTEQNLVQIDTTTPDIDTCPPSSRMTYEQMRLILQQHPCVCHGSPARAGKAGHQAKGWRFEDERNRGRVDE